MELGLGRGTLATLAERNGRVIGVTCQSQFLAARSFRSSPRHWRVIFLFIVFCQIKLSGLDRGRQGSDENFQ